MWNFFSFSPPSWNIKSYHPHFSDEKNEASRVYFGAHPVWGWGWAEAGVRCWVLWPRSPHFFTNANSKCHTSLGEQNHWFCQCKLPCLLESAIPFRQRNSPAQRPVPAPAVTVKGRKHAASNTPRPPLTERSFPHLNSPRTQPVFLLINNMTSYITGSLIYKTN